MPDFAGSEEPAGALVTYPAGGDLLNAIERFLAIARQDPAAPLLAPILLREIHARLLVSPQGAILRRFLRRDDPSNHLARAMASIRTSLHQPLSVSALAAARRNEQVVLSCALQSGDWSDTWPVSERHPTSGGAPPAC